MDILGCIPARIYVSIPMRDPEAAQAYLQQLAEELDTLDITDADVALFAESEGRIRPDFTRPMGIVAGPHGFLPLPTDAPPSAGYTVRLQVLLAPGLHRDDTTNVLAESGLLGEHFYVFPESANAVEACELAEQRLRHEWAAIPDLATTILVDILSVVRRTRRDPPTSAPSSTPEIARAD